MTINQLVDIVEAIAGTRLRRVYDPGAPKGVNGRSSDNTRIAQQLGWAPRIPLQIGLERTYRWIYDQMVSGHEQLAIKNLTEFADRWPGRSRAMRDVQMPAAEDERNRVLRRADWRFLLPAPDPVRTVLYTNGALGEAVRAVSERVVDGCRDRPDGECDLAVAVDPDDATLRAAWAALRPGGSCYTEWSAGGLRPAEVDRRLRRARFLDVTCYIPRPDPRDAAPQAWVPLGVAAARRWYLHRTRGAPGLRHALGRARRELGWRLASWCRMPSVLCVVARKPPALSARHTFASPVEDFQTGLCRVIRAGHSNRACPALPPWVLLTQGAHSLNKIVLLVLTSDGKPEYVVKVPRTAAAADAIEREAAVLKRVHAICRDLAGIPRVVFTGSAGGVRLVVETPVHGTPLSRLVHRADYRTLAVKATDWQAGADSRGGSSFLAASLDSPDIGVLGRAAERRRRSASGNNDQGRSWCARIAPDRVRAARFRALEYLRDGRGGI